MFSGTVSYVILFALTSLAAVFVAVTTNGSKRLSFLSLQSSPWTWTPTNATPPSSHFSLHSFSANQSSLPNPKPSLYPHFSNPKMQKVVDKLIKDLDAESLRRRGKPRDGKMEKIEASLARARALIRQAIVNGSQQLPLHDADYIPQGEIYRNPLVFHRSYKLMESLFKIFVYEEGEPPLFHYGPCRDIYSLEGILLGLIEKNTRFRTYNPDEAHVYFLPFSVVKILEHLFHPIRRDKAVLERVIGDYVRIISTKYPYWNRSLGDRKSVV